MKRVNGNSAITAIDTLALNVAELLKQLSETDENVAFIRAKITELQQLLNSAIKRDKVYSGLDEADRERDEVLKKIDATLNGLAALPVNEIAEAAKVLLSEWKKYTLSISGEGYEKESSLIESFYADALKHSAEIKALPGFQILLDALRAKEDAFKAKTDSFVKAQAAGAKSATAIKKELIAFINSCLLPYLESRVIIKGGVYESVSKELSVRLSRL